jgi:hypothetical protein
LVTLMGAVFRPVAGQQTTRGQQARTAQQIGISDLERFAGVIP